MASNPSSDLQTGSAPPHPSALTTIPPDMPSMTLGLVLASGAVPVPGYVLKERAGRGGFGEVWKAEAPGKIPIAMKFIPLSCPAGETELRALEGIKAVRHPHLLPVFAAWQEHGYLILAMELADATLMDELRTIVKQGHPGIPFTKLLEFMRDAAEGLDHLREVQLLHRDVKPQNLLLVGRRVKVGDFGLLKVVSESSVAASGSMTPLYAAPEMFNHRAKEHSDQYSLAVTYCQLRSNKLPFHGAAPTQLMHAHLFDSPDLSMLTEAERPVVQRALAKGSEDRWPSCTAFVQTLAAALAGDKALALGDTQPMFQPPVSVATPPKPAPLPESQPPRNWKRRLKLTALALAVGMAVIAIGLASRWSEITGEVRYNSLQMKLVRVPAGSFSMGSPDGELHREIEEVPHDVEITKSFFMGGTEVTQEQYVRVMGVNPSFYSGEGGSPLHPVDSVSWDEAVAFCVKLSALPEEQSAGRKYRLPTEAEWEWASRARSKNATHFGSSLTSAQANFDGYFPHYSSSTGVYLKKTVPVGSYKANGYGLVDMHGNVAEWCQDWYAPGYYARSSARDPVNAEPTSERVLRGGAWVNLGHQCRCAARRGWPPETKLRHIGFRVVCEITEP